MENVTDKLAGNLHELWAMSKIENGWIWGEVGVGRSLKDWVVRISRGVERETPHHILLHHLTPHHTTSDHTTSYYTTPHYIRPYHIMSYHTIPREEERRSAQDPPMHHRVRQAVCHRETVQHFFGTGDLEVGGIGKKRRRERKRGGRGRS